MKNIQDYKELLSADDFDTNTLKEAFLELSSEFSATRSDKDVLNRIDYLLDMYSKVKTPEEAAEIEELEALAEIEELTNQEQS